MFSVSYADGADDAEVMTIAMTAALENNGSVNAQVPLNVVNTKGPDLPVTGDDGVWKYGVISILLMTGSTIAIILVLKGKKEPKSKR